MSRRTIPLGIAAIAVALTWSTPALAEAVNVNFESFALGALPGGADPRTPGDKDTWWVPDNAATGAEVKAGIGRSGSKGLHVFNRGNNNDGVIDNAKSGRLAETAGEPSTGAPHSNFRSEYWFRTESATEQKDFAFATESYGTDRTTSLYFVGDNYRYTAPTGGSGIFVEADGYTGNGDYLGTFALGQLNWGEWYRVVTDIVFVAGEDNDTVLYSIYDEGGALVTSTANKTWEQGQRYNGWNGGQLVAVDAVQFHMRGSPVDSLGVYVDNVSWASFTPGAGDVPEPGSLALVLAAGLGGLVATRRRR